MQPQSISFAKRRPAAPPAPGASTPLAVEGITCGNCALKAGEALRAVPGVAAASVSAQDGQAQVRWGPGVAPDLNALAAALKQAGFGLVSPPEGAGASPAPRTDPWRTGLLTGIACTLPLMIGEWVFHLGMDRTFQGVALVLATVVQFVSGWRFYRGAWRQMLARTAGMDALVVLGSSTAWLYSTIVWLAGGPVHTFFLESASIITLISAGHWVEARAGSRAEVALRALMTLAPATARRLPATPGPAESETGEETPISALRLGDRILLKPGDRVPLDGRVLEGASAVDESMLTGEPMPVDKAPDDLVYGGTINLNGRLTVKVAATGEATALARIIEAVQRAQTSRASIQRLGDRVSSVFVPVVVLIALGTGIFWGVRHGLGEAVAHAAAVLIVACPCAMGLATPVAIMAAANAAARRGILIRDGVALEKAGTITHVVLDKTGTLTRGKPLVSARQFYGDNPAFAAGLAAGLAAHSNHPLSRAVSAAGRGADAPNSQRIDLEDWREVPGAGVEATVPGPSGGTARLGSLAWLQSKNVSVAAAETLAAGKDARSATILGLALDQRLLGAFALEDSIQAGAAEVVRSLKAQGCAVYMATGDHPRAAQAVALQAGILPGNVRAQLRPADKSAWIASLQAAGAKVAFIGDGLNDAPALQQADLGIAVRSASDIAGDSADIMLLKPGLGTAPEALALARFALRIIKQNLFWAFFYNAAAIPLAAAGYISPVLCAAAMGMSDLMVIGNALRLLRWKPLSPCDRRQKRQASAA